MRNPVADNQDSLTAGESDPVLMQDFQLIEELTHQTRQRFAERGPLTRTCGAPPANAEAQSLRGVSKKHTT